MASMFGYVSVPAFIVSSLVKFIVTTVWYSKPVFGTWAKRLAFGKRRRPKPSLQHLAVSAIGSIVSFSFFSTVLHVAKCQTPLDGALWGLALGLFFDSGMNASHCFFENRSFSLFLLHNGCHAVSLTTAGIVLALLCGSPSA